MIRLPSVPKTDAEAIAFALDYLEPFRIRDFLSEWRAGKDLRPWLEALNYARQDMENESRCEP